MAKDLKSFTQWWFLMYIVQDLKKDIELRSTKCELLVTIGNIKDWAKESH